MSQDITKQAADLIESIRRKGTPDHGKKLLLDTESSEALNALLKFLAREVSVYSTHHDIKQAAHVLELH